LIARAAELWVGQYSPIVATIEHGIAQTGNACHLDFSAFSLNAYGFPLTSQ